MKISDTRSYNETRKMLIDTYETSEAKSIYYRQREAEAKGQQFVIKRCRICQGEMIKGSSICKFCGSQN